MPGTRAMDMNTVSTLPDCANEDVLCIQAVPTEIAGQIRKALEGVWRVRVVLLEGRDAAGKRLRGRADRETAAER